MSPAAMTASVHDHLMVFRPMAQMVQWFVIPEVRRRLEQGRIDPATLPIEVDRFQVVWPPRDRTDEPAVRLNTEVQLIVQVKARKAIAAGQAVTLNDIHAESCMLVPPTTNGCAVAYYLALSSFMQFMTFFDFTANQPDNATQSVPLAFPVADIVRLQHLAEQHPPSTVLEELENLNWPPSPGYYPELVADIAAAKASGTEKDLSAKIAAIFDGAYWNTRLALWQELGIFPGRDNYIVGAIDRFMAKDFISCIHVLVPQFEGILRDHVKPKTELGFRALLREFEKNTYRHNVVMFPKVALERILRYLECGSFLSRTNTIADPAQQLNRHGVAHGLFKGFENREIALKYLILLDSLSFLIMHDRVLSGTL